MTQIINTINAEDLKMYNWYVLDNGKTVARYYGEYKGQYLFMTDTYFELKLDNLNGVTLHPSTIK